MYDIKNDVENLSLRLKNFLSEQSEYFPHSFIQRIDSEVSTLINVKKPKIMVYGIYNAGKSTLINSIIGKAVAETRDCPTTYKIDEYECGDYILVDSPGVDAPIEHQIVTENNISKCHVILYVISTKGGFESIKNYQNMYNLIKTDKPFIIVINDKEGDENLNSSENINRIKCKIIENLKMVSHNEKIENLFDTIAVNAKRAFLGKTKNKDILYNKSNVELLKDRISCFLDSNEAMRVFIAPLSNLASLIDEMAEYIQGNLNIDKDEIFSVYNKKIKTRRMSYMEDIPYQTDMLVNRYESALIQSAYNNDNDKWQKNLNSLYDEFDALYSETIRNIITSLNAEFNEIDFSKIISDNTVSVSDNLSKSDTIDFDVKSDNSSDISLHLDNSSEVSDSSSFSENPTPSFKFPNIGSNLNPLSYIPVLMKLFESGRRKKQQKELEEFRQIQERIAESNRIAEQNALNEARHRQDIRIAVQTQSHKIKLEMRTVITDAVCKLLDSAERCILNEYSHNQEKKQLLLNLCGKLNEFKSSVSVIRNRIG